MTRVRRMMLSTLVATVGFVCLGAVSDEVVRGDSAWASRGDAHGGERPHATPIRDAVAAYENALAANPGSLEARWKLLRALHFGGDFAATEPQEKRAFFESARRIAEDGLDRLADRVAGGVRLEQQEPEAIRALLEAADVSSSDVARLYFWSAINWGAWSRDVGLLTAVQQGVANRLHGYTRVTIALEPGYDDGGALRLLGRLHAELPRVPLVTGWVDRDQALPLVERAYALAPANPGNRLLLALTLLDLAPERRDEALALLEEVGRLSPRPTMRIEDLAMRREARQALSEAHRESS